MALLGGHIPGWEVDVMRCEEGSCVGYISNIGQRWHTIELLGLIKASVRTLPSPNEDNFGISRFEAVRGSRGHSRLYWIQSVIVQRRGPHLI